MAHRSRKKRQTKAQAVAARAKKVADRLTTGKAVANPGLIGRLSAFSKGGGGGGLAAVGGGGAGLIDRLSAFSTAGRGVVADAGGALSKGKFLKGFGGKLGAAGLASFVLSLLGDFVGGLGDDRRRTAEFRRITGNPDLLRGSVLANLEDDKLNQIRVGRNLARLKRLGIQSPKVMQAIEQRALGNDPLAPGEIQLGRSAIADRDDLLKALASRSDLFHDG